MSLSHDKNPVARHDGEFADRHDNGSVDRHDNGSVDRHDNGSVARHDGGSVDRHDGGSGPRAVADDVFQQAARDWAVTVDDLIRLARRQLVEIRAGETESLGTTLKEKERAYRKADDASRRARERADILSSRSLDGPEIFHFLESELSGRLSELAVIENESQSLLAARLESVREELKDCLRKRTALRAYAPSSPASPRFLDRKQ